MIRNLLKRREGQGMAEYGLILALVAVVAIAAVMLLGPRLKDVFEDIVNAL
ncbi:MAG TPA: Flp family type IVb pilin [Symbiobacteriaceae bacterium]|nr:Flp family type IVb pilin [Symbiobacteriaceae bacterium]